MMHRPVIHSALLIVLAASCAQGVQESDPPTAQQVDLKAEAAAHYEGYGQALANGQRTAIADFYHPEGALIVFNGDPQRQSRDVLRRRYEGAWTPPAWFAWEDLAFDSLAPDKVLVTGGFRWHSAGESDTTRFIYAAILVASDSGMGIVFEHETLRP